MEIDFIGERIVSADVGQTILEASLRSGIPHYHACGGNAKCSTCRIKIVEGSENLSSISRKEQKLRKSITLSPDVRLACQTTVTKGTVKVVRLIRDDSDISKQLNGSRYLSEDTLNSRPLGEERHLVLLFLDIRDFTPFVETNLPYDVIDVWRRLFGIFYKAIENHRGTVIETAGDQLYAVFGFSSSLKEASKGAIEAGRKILEELEKFNGSPVAMAFPREFQVGIGIHSGKVIVGEMQLGKMKKTSVMGLAVNIASRIQEATKTLNNSLVVSDEALLHSTLVASGQEETISLKGISSAVRVHLLGRPYFLKVP